MYRDVLYIARARTTHMDVLVPRKAWMLRAAAQDDCMDAGGRQRLEHVVERQVNGGEKLHIV